MTTKKPHANFSNPKGTVGPFRRAVLRGLGILLPPLLTIVIFLWVGNTVNSYLLEPLERGARWVLVEKLADIRSADDVPADKIIRGVTTIDGEQYHLTSDAKLVPLAVYNYVRDPLHLGNDPMPVEARQIYTQYVNQHWLQPSFVLPVFFCLFVLALYLLGKFLAAGMGRFFWNQIERLIHHMPLVRNVYSSVKQFTDFFFSEQEIPYTRVVAVEYPRKGMWTLAFLTGEGMYDIRMATSEPMVTVFVPTSPMPFTGFALTARKSEVVDMNITVDQAIQFLVSCGVVIPPPPAGTAIPKLEHGGSPERALPAMAAVAGDG